MDSVNFLNLEYVYVRILDFFKNFDIVAILNWFIHIIDKIEPFAIAFCVFLGLLILYTHLELRKVKGEEERRFHALRLKEAAAEPNHDPVLNQKWQLVEKHMASGNPAEWRLAILEADVMLETILEKMGYQGDTMGDKLKGIEKSDFLTLDLAWEAHKVRNQIAHEGSDYLLNERDARRVIDLYRKVFEEFYYI